jgi:hypothetical protein
VLLNMLKYVTLCQARFVIISFNISHYVPSVEQYLQYFQNLTQGAKQVFFL